MKKDILTKLWMNGSMTQTNKILKVVIDTNILLVSIPKQSKYHKIIQNLKDGNFNLCISNDVLTEYKEILAKKINLLVAESICEALILYENVIKTNIYYNWNLIFVDPDDNKFVDCAIAGNADYIVTNDKHFNILKSIDFPKINVINIDEFIKLIKK